MAYFPASCDYDCKGCSQNICGWCAFYDCPVRGTALENENQIYSTTITRLTKEGEK